ncbi:hypothetical protein Tco_1220109 [Tanacetum coccineum]
MRSNTLPNKLGRDDIDKAAATTDLSTQVKRKHGDQDEDLTAGSDKGKEKKRPIKDSQPSKKSSASKESSKGKTLPKTSKPGNSITAEEPDDEHVHEVSMDAEENIVDEMGNAEETTLIREDYTTEDKCPFDLSKPLPLKGRPSHLTIPVEYFFNNDLEYLKSENMERKYITSIMKTKAARYELVEIEDMIPKQQWSTIKVDKQFGYGYLEEIVVRRADRQLYMFKEGDFITLHLNDIEDMLLLVVQHKLFHLDGDVIIDLAVALHGTLKLVRDTLHHRLRNFRLGYNKAATSKADYAQSGKIGWCKGT